MQEVQKTIKVYSDSDWAQDRTDRKQKRDPKVLEASIKRLKSQGQHDDNTDATRKDRAADLDHPVQQELLSMEMRECKFPEVSDFNMKLLRTFRNWQTENSQIISIPRRGAPHRDGLGM